LRAVVFVRRSGAMGLGHVGWAFEWKTGWFNAGSVENIAGAARAAPKDMDFWSSHSLDPVACMLAQEIPYDAYKVFTVAEPQPKDAWKAVVWLSRRPYSVVRRNCADCAYDVLRSFGVRTLIDTARVNVPNDWYDWLPGPSYPIGDYQVIPLRPGREDARARLGKREIKLTIPARIQASPPPWHARGGRVWYELRANIDRLTTIARRFIRRVRERIRRDLGGVDDASTNQRERQPERPSHAA
jgi:hypothetical protein